MRRFLFGAGCYLAGIMTLPLLMVGVGFLSARSVSHDTHDQPYRGIIAVQDPDVPCPVALPAAGNCRHAPAAALELTDSLAQADVKAAEDPFGQPAVPPARSALPVDDDSFGASDLSQPEPVVQPEARVFRHGVMPIGPEILATGAPQDEAEVARAKELRETLKKIVEEKAEMLNSQGLEVEIKLHQTHLTELKSLKELLALQRSLQELRDKFPESDAGRRASELLNLLEQQHHRGVGPTPDQNFGPSPRDNFQPLPDPNNFEDAPIKAKGA